MCAVSRFKLAEDVLNVHFDSAAGSPKLTGNLLVREALGDKRQHFHLARRECDFREVSAKPLGDFRRHQSLAGVDRPNGMEHIGVHHFLQKIATSARFERLINLLVSVKARERDNSRGWKLPANL